MVLHLSKCRERLHALLKLPSRLQPHWKISSLYVPVQGGYLISVIPARSRYLKQFRIRGAVDSRRFEIFRIKRILPVSGISNPSKNLRVSWKNCQRQAVPGRYLIFFQKHLGTVVIYQNPVLDFLRTMVIYQNSVFDFLRTKVNIK